MERNEYGQLEFYQLFFKGEFYIDFTTLMSITSQPSSTLHRILTTLKNVPCITYKNRKYYKTSFALQFWRIVGEQNQNN